MTDHTYDEFPYPNLAFPQTHPLRSATIARLFGMETPPPSRSRILELGCGPGGNLIAMGVELPDAELVGIDLSKRHIEQGQAAIAATGIKNVILRQADVTTLGDSLGQFDYVIAHGLYSWLPDSIRQQLPEICRRHLKPSGVAYISYNCNPGWRIRSILRDMMLFHTARIEGAQNKVAQARAVLDFIVASASEKSTYATLLRDEAALLRQQQDGYIFHEYLENNNHPVHFYEFVEHVDSAGLKYLAEASVRSMLDSFLSPEAQETLHRISQQNVIQREQYMDFIRNRGFRQSLLVHRDAAVNRAFDWKALRSLFIAGFYICDNPEFDPNSPETIEFSTAEGFKFSTAEPLVKAALQIMTSQWPQPLYFDSLVTNARCKLPGCAYEQSPREEDLETLGQYFLEAFYYEAVELVVEPWLCKAAISDTPAVSELTRLQAKSGEQITNLRHQRTATNPFLMRLVQLLDGKHTLGNIADALHKQAMSGAFQIKRQGQVVSDSAQIRQLIADDLPGHLQHLKFLSLLVN